MINKKAIRCLYANIRSIIKPGKLDELRCVVDSFKCILHLIILTETWIKNNEEAKRIQIPGYTHYYQYRQNTLGGGVSIFARNTMKHNVIQELSQDDNHYLWIHLEKFSIDIGAIYKPGRTNVKTFLDTFSSQLDNRKRAVAFGDFNFDLLAPDRLVEEYKDALKESGFTIINKIEEKYCTRETYQKKSLLDHVASNLKGHRFHLAVIDSSMSDHKQIYFEIDKYEPEPKRKTTYESIDYTKLSELVKNKNKGDSNVDYARFETRLLQAINQSKVKKNKILNPPKQDWVNKDILHKINQKNILYKQHKNNPGNQDIKTKFLNERDKVAEQIQTMKSKFYLKKFSECNKKPRKMWNLIDSLTNNKIKGITLPNRLIKEDTELKDGREICECFCEFFSTVGSILAEAIDKKYHNNKTYTNATPLIANPNFGLEKFNLATKEEITKIIDNLDSNTGSGIDNISTKVVKSLKSYITEELTECINVCLESGNFPDSLKIAKVTPIFKSGTKSDPNNYRPISVLPVISKIFEKIIYNRLDAYLTSINFLYPKQYGFRTMSNTLSATVDLVNKIKNSIDEKKIALGIFIDLKKAFDTVSHELLLNKLNDIGINGTAHKIFKSYLTNRLQIVKIGEYQSTPRLITYGVPQGSILGSILFLIYINNISKLELKGELSLYADDTTLFYYGNNIDNVIRDSQDDLNILNVWFQCNLLTLNVSKTHYVIFSAKNKKINDFEPPKINNTNISRSDCEKYLGLILDNKLTWKEHIKYVKSKLISLTGVLRSVVRCLPRKVCYIIYNSLVKPHIDYLIQIWGSAAKTNLISLQRAQNKLIKILFRYNFLTATEKIYKETKLMNITNTYKYNTCILIRKILSKDIHTNISFTTKNKYPHLRRLRSANNIILRPPRTNYGKRNITFESAQLYNKLPSNIKECKSMQTFKKLLKSYFSSQ